MDLKPQDVLVSLKIALIHNQQPTFERLAQELNLESSAIHRAIQRASHAGLLRQENRRSLRPQTRALEEFLIHGIRYCFAATYGGPPTRGMPTAHAAPPLNILILSDGDPPPVWPDAQGTVRGLPLIPIHKSVPFAARHDPRLYEFLSLIDTLRIGRARERALAQRELSARLLALDGTPA